MSYYVVGQRVLARVGRSSGGEFSWAFLWVPGVVLGHSLSCVHASRPYEVRLDKPVDGTRVHYFPVRGVVDDNARNRRSRKVVEA